MLETHPFRYKHMMWDHSRYNKIRLGDLDTGSCIVVEFFSQAQPVMNANHSCTSKEVKLTSMLIQKPLDHWSKQKPNIDETQAVVRKDFQKIK